MLFSNSHDSEAFSLAFWCLEGHLAQFVGNLVLMGAGMNFPFLCVSLSCLHFACVCVFFGSACQGNCCRLSLNFWCFEGHLAQFDLVLI